MPDPPKITIQDDKVVIRDNKVGTEVGCCCGCCPSISSADQTTQPNVAVSGSTCSCETGTHNGNYPFVGWSEFMGYGWSGTTNCDVQEDAFGTVFLAPFSVGIDCDCVVSVSTYELSGGGFPTGMAGTADGSSLTVDASGHISGAIDVVLSDVNGNTCSVTVTFG